MLTIAVSDALKKILLDGPVTSAHLKLSLDRTLRDSTGRGFSEHYPNFKKFSQFLYAVTDVLDVVPPNGPGDIKVGLRGSLNSPATVKSTALTRTAESTLPSPVWLAFTNLDTNRRRFVHRLTGVIEHFSEEIGGAANTHDRFAVDPNYVEIKPIALAVQGLWMSEFLQSSAIEPAALMVLNNIASLPPTSQSNQIWQVALGRHAIEWRRYRSARIVTHVREWAAEHEVPIHFLLPGPSHSAAAQPANEPPGTMPICESPPSNLRAEFARLIDSMTDDELRQVVLPMHIAAKLTSR